MRRLIPLRLSLAFFASGAAALIYEALWLRRFALLLGATAPATAAVLSALFLGVALGSALFGMPSVRARRPLLLFAAIETGIAAAAFAVEPLLAWIGDPLAAAGNAHPDFGLVLRMGTAMATVLPATILMGGSFPVLAQALHRGGGGLGRLGGGLYAVNTLGAALGVLAVPFALLPSCGAAATLWIAAALNVLAALAACSLSRAPRAAPTPSIGPSARLASGGWLITGAFLSGCVALSLETLWTRMLALVHENSLQAFAVVTAIFLAGLAAAAAGARRLIARGVSARRVAAVGWMLAGGWIVATPPIFHALTSGLRALDAGRGMALHLAQIGGLACATILPATLFAGAALPALMETAGAGRVAAAGPVLGGLLFVNTMGAFAGPLLASFVVGPLFGLWGGLVLCGLLLLVAGQATLPGVARRWPLLRRLAISSAAAGLLALWAPWSLPVVRLGPGERLIDLAEGPFGAVGVVESNGDRRMTLNNSYVLGGTASTGEERLQAHLPLLLHPAPERVAFLGVGTGITTGASLFHPVREVAAIELVPDVLRAARRFFREANLGVLEDPRVRVYAEDARTRLRASPGRFDVIVGDLVVPWRRGEAGLHTREGFETARRALAPGGVFCQWIPLFQLSQSEFESIAAAFLDVFRESLLFRGDFRAGEPALALVGFTNAGPLDSARIDARSEALARRADPANPYLAHPAGLWVYLAGSLSRDDAALRRAPANRDGFPYVEVASAATQAGRRAVGAGPFVRAPLRRWLEALAARPIAGTPLTRLDAEHLRWRSAGLAIWTASLLDLEGDRAGADALGLGGVAMLPDELQKVIRGAR